jgi:hypothetical protein
MVLLLVAVSFVRDAWPASNAATVSLPSATERSVVVGERYRSGGTHRFFFGDEYRDLWVAPITVPELNLRTVAGGLTTERRTSGKETAGLVMKGADGREFRFRSIDKDPTDILPKEYHGTFIDRVVQDQIAATFPGGTVAVSPLMRAAGVLHAEPVIVVLPDDPLLGEFREEFAGMVGTFEEHPEADKGDPHTFGAVDIISGEKMWKQMDEDPNGLPDARAFLTARLVDLLVGDWDRHREQWRWAKLPGHDRWQPVPEDRDQAFIHFQGVIPGVAHLRAKRFVSFDDQYPHVEAITFNGRDGDRRILVDLEKPVWDDVARDVERRITDAVIADAAAALPPAYRELEGATLEARLRARRDALPEIADQFYRLLAVDVDLRGTDGDDLVAINHRDNRDVAIAIAGRGASAPYRYRLFHPDETQEVRIYLLGGADSVVTTGPSGGITVRVIGGKGDDYVDDGASTGLHVYDESPTNTILRGRNTSLSSRSYTPPPREEAEWIPPRDWGKSRSIFPFIGGDTDVGLLLLAGVRQHGYGFRKDPWADQQTLRVMYGTRPSAWAADYKGDFRHENSGVLTRIQASASAVDFLHFYGFGNETGSPGDEDFYDVNVAEYAVEPSLIWPFGDHLLASVGVRGQYTVTHSESGSIEVGSLYGADDFVQAGAGLGLTLDARNAEKIPMQGLRAEMAANVYPPLASVEETFGEVHGEVSYSHSIISSLSLGVRAGGKRVWNDAPYFEAAYVGGAGSLRGFPRQRFAGDGSLFGSGEVRLPVTQLHILPPGCVGLFGFYDVGRVFAQGESSNKWHEASGGGFWIALPDANHIISLSIASGKEGNRFYVGSGLSF